MEETKYLELLNKYNENHKVLLELQNKRQMAIYGIH